MSRGLAVSMPTPDEVRDTAGALAALAGLVGGAWALLFRWRKRCRAAKERRELEAKAIRYLLDAMRHSLGVLVPGEARFVDVDELARQKWLVDEVRDLLWIADGHESEREAQRRASDLANVLTRTQAIKVKEQGNPFADGWTPEDDRR